MAGQARCVVESRLGLVDGQVAMWVAASETTDAGIRSVEAAAVASRCEWRRDGLTALPPLTEFGAGAAFPRMSPASCNAESCGHSTTSRRQDGREDGVRSAARLSFLRNLRLSLTGQDVRIRFHFSSIRRRLSEVRIRFHLP